jgi:6-phosphogluconolactonase (cycloisomerase 2 family)
VVKGCLSSTVDCLPSPVYVTTSKNGKFLVSAQFYSGKVQVYEKNQEDGSLKLVSTTDSGIESHGIFWSLDGRYLFVPSKAEDTLKSFVFDAETGALTHH